MMSQDISQQDILQQKAKETLFQRITLKDSATLNLTSRRLIRSKNNKITETLQNGRGIDIDCIDMAFPIKKSQFNIHYTVNDLQSNQKSRFITTYETLEKNAMEVCEQITSAIQKKRNLAPNEHGWLLLQEGEKILETAKVMAKKGDGIFYVTTNGLYFENEKEGLGFKLPYSMYSSCQINGKIIAIKYTEEHLSKITESHTFVIRAEKKDIKKITQMIAKQYKESHAQEEQEFDVLQKKFGNIKGADLKKILMQKSIHPKTGDAIEDMLPETSNWFDLVASRVTTESYELQRYIGYLADEIFGDSRPKVQWCFCSNWFERSTVFGDSGHCFEKFHPNGENRKNILSDPQKAMTAVDEMVQAHGDFHFRMMEMRLIKTALLLDVPLEEIGKHTVQYYTMIKEYEKEFEIHRDFEMNHYKSKRKYDAMLASTKGKTKEEYEKIIKSKEFQDCTKQYKKYGDIRIKYTSKSQTTTDDISNGGFEFDWNTEWWKKTYESRAITEYTTLLFRIYDYWKKDIILTGYTEPQNTRWIEHILQSMPWPDDDTIMFRNEKKYLTDEIMRIDGLKKTLSRIRFPEGIPKKHQFANDCWLDESKGIVFSRASIAKKAASIAKIKDDIALQKHGFSAYGFAAKDVEMLKEFGNLPTIMVSMPRFPADKIQEPIKVRIVLSAVPSERITPEMVICMSSGSYHMELPPYKRSIALNAGRIISEEQKTHIIESFNRYADTGIIKYTGDQKSYPPSIVFTSAMALETIDIAFAIRNSGAIYTGPEDALPFVESYNKTQNPMPFAVDTRVLPLYERIRRMQFVMITGEKLISRPDDYEQAQEEYNNLKKENQTDQTNPLPTVSVNWHEEIENILNQRAEKEK